MNVHNILLRKNGTVVNSLYTMKCFLISQF